MEAWPQNKVSWLNRQQVWQVCNYSDICVQVGEKGGGVNVWLRLTEFGVYYLVVGRLSLQVAQVAGRFVHVVLPQVDAAVI